MGGLCPYGSLSYPWSVGFTAETAGVVGMPPIPAEIKLLPRIDRHAPPRVHPCDGVAPATQEALTRPVPNAAGRPVFTTPPDSGRGRRDG